MRSCLVCGRPARNSRCKLHPSRRRQPERTYAERERRRRTVQEHIATHGYTCPGWGVPPHRSRDLTADHILPQVHGGGNGPLRVLCRKCNSRRGVADTNARRRGRSSLTLRG